jgi:redox-sensitive bicupin YhaK (pirin superfamily)
MIIIRKNSDRGSTKTSWLDSQHTFSFGSYHDPLFINFGALRVINEDVVLASSGFAPHSHRDMEIITYILEGALEHKDSLGTGSIIMPGEVQLMRAGTGITHSEFNPSKDKRTHLLQIWIIPDQKDLKPSYQQKNFQQNRKVGHMTILVSPDGNESSLTIHQDVKLSVLDLNKDGSFSQVLNPDRMIWIQVAKGEISLNDQKLEQGDGAAITHEEILKFGAHKDAEVLIFDLALR